MKIKRTISLDEETSNAAEKILRDIGFSFSGAINLFLRQVVEEDGLPFVIKRGKQRKEEGEQ